MPTALSAISPDAALSAAIVIALAVLGAFWKFANLLGRISGTLERILTALADHTESLARVDNRVTEHRRRNDEAISNLRDHLDRKLAGLSEGQARSDALHRSHDDEPDLR